MLKHSAYAHNLERLEAALASGRFEGRVLTDEDKRALKAEIDAEKVIWKSQRGTGIFWRIEDYFATPTW